RAPRARAEHGARVRAARHSRRAFRDRRRHPQRDPPRRQGPAGFAARSRRHRRDLSARAAPAAQRLDLGGGATALGRALLTSLLSSVPQLGHWPPPPRSARFLGTVPNTVGHGQHHYPVVGHDVRAARLFHWLWYAVPGLAPAQPFSPILSRGG